MQRDTTFSILKTSYGMQKRSEFFAKDFGVNLPRVTNDVKLQNNIEAIKLFYNVGTRVAYKYYELISDLGKANLVKLRREVGFE